MRSPCFWVWQTHCAWGAFPPECQAQVYGQEKAGIVFHLWILQVQDLASTSLQFPRKGAYRGQEVNWAEAGPGHLPAN